MNALKTQEEIDLEVWMERLSRLFIAEPSEEMDALESSEIGRTAPPGAIVGYAVWLLVGGGVFAAIRALFAVVM